MAQRSVTNMEPQDAVISMVKVRKVDYDKVIKVLSHQQSQLKQQELKLKATDNLFNLLQSKDAEVRQCKENEATLRAALDRSEQKQQKLITERLAARSAQCSLQMSIPVTKTSVLQEDGAMSCMLRNNDLEADCANSYKTFDVIHAQPSLCDSSDSLKMNSMAMPRSTVATFVPTCNAPLQITSAPTVSFSSVTSVCSPCSMPLPHSTPSLTSSVVNSMPMQQGATISKDLVERVMQQNMRLKKAIRDVLQHKGLSVSEYLQKREYEDVVEMLRHDVKRLEHKVVQLQAIINSRDSGETDQLSRKCSDLTTMVSQLERKLALQQAYVKEANEKLQSATKLTATSTVHDLAPEASSKHYKQLLDETRQLKAKVAELDEARQRESEHFIEQRQRLEEMKLNVAKTTEELAASNAEVARLQKMYDSMEAEKHIVQNQVVAFEEDFNVERREKIQQKEYYEKLIGQHQEWVRRLANEAQTCRGLLEAEKTAKEGLETQLRHIRMSSESCTSQARMAQPNRSNSHLDGRVFADGDASNPSQKVFVCPRCEREFVTQDKLSQHREKCTDD